MLRQGQDGGADGSGLGVCTGKITSGKGQRPWQYFRSLPLKAEGISTRTQGQLGIYDVEDQTEQ